LAAAVKHFLKSIFKSNFWIKLKSWEYWPFGIIQFPFFIYWLWLSLRARSLLFFSASNPTIPTGGMMGESKFDVLQKIPSSLIPRSVRISYPSTPDKVIQRIRDEGFAWPVVFKPDLGERGWMVRIVHTEEDVIRYIDEITLDFIIQERVDWPLEFGVYYRRFPSEDTGEVTSIVMKEMLYVEGDGMSTLAQLIEAKERAKLQREVLYHRYESQWQDVLPKGKRMELVSIGNHCLGTKFLDGCHLIDERLTASFDRISKQIDGFYFGRFDLKTKSIDDLRNGNVMIMELNGCGAEPAHIYQPGYPLWKAMKVMTRHWRELYRVSMENHRRGVHFMTLKEGLAIYKKVRAINRG